MICPHTNQISDGDIFFCLPGGEPYVAAACKAGAKAVVYGDREKMADLGNQVYKNPSHTLKVVGVTGTNGKTTVTHLLAEALTLLGKKPLVSGTLTERLTTPESIETLAKMRQHRHNNGTHYIMEVSSHGIDQGRHWGIQYDVKCLTNISQDHLDYHKTLEAYHAVKEQFLSEGASAVVRGDQLDSVVPISNPRVKGPFNQENLQVAYACLVALGEDPSAVRESLSQVSAPPGRFEYIDQGQPFSVIVDYAHTPDGLEKILQAVQQDAPKRLVVLFGCGGDRDRGKRSKMGKIAASYADQIVVTNDNPRSEDPMAIATDIQAGIPDTVSTEIILDRKKAIESILSTARAGDSVLLAGKGHETTQVLADKTIDLDDRQEARRILDQLYAH